jgi:hypothetical protein
MKNLLSTPASFEHIQSFLDHSRGQITIGEIPPIRSAALAAEGDGQCTGTCTLPPIGQPTPVPFMPQYPSGFFARYCW